MRASGVRGLLIYCSDYQCSHWTSISGDRWPDDVRLSDLEGRFTCQACGARAPMCGPISIGSGRLASLQETKLLGVPCRTQTQSCKAAK